jgi:hypothetical protein
VASPASIDLMARRCRLSVPNVNLQFFTFRLQVFIHPYYENSKRSSEFPCAFTPPNSTEIGYGSSKEPKIAIQMSKCSDDCLIFFFTEKT